MNPSPPAEFARYRFVRDARGDIVSLPSGGVDKSVRLVLDHERWGLARLHLFAGAAAREDRLQAFQRNAERIAESGHPRCPRLLSWGREGEDFLYADEMWDGEPLPTYLARAGGVPMGVACEWVREWLPVLSSIPFPSVPSEKLSPRHFEVVENREGQVFLVLSECGGWAPSSASSLEPACATSDLAGLFCALLAGDPNPTDCLEALAGLPPVLREAVLRALEEGGGDADDAFRSALRTGSVTAPSERSRVAAPRTPLREWLRCDLEVIGGDMPGAFPAATATVVPTGEPYAVPAHLRGNATLMQLLPGPEAIPRDDWLNQHHAATRRPGRGLPHQLQVNYIEDRGSLTLIGEERIEGIDLGSWIARTGPLSLESARDIAGAIHAALATLEARAGACAVWWLPPENVLLVTEAFSPRDPDDALLEDTSGAAWTSFPLKFRLHQTLATLREGASLPSKVRELTRLPGKPYEPARRSVIALPLLWHLLTGSRFHWSDPVVPSDRIPAALAEMFEQRRQLLRADPTATPDDFFLAFAQWTPPEPPLESSVETLPPATEPEPPAAPRFVAATFAPVRAPSPAAVGLWAFLLGVVAASVTGFFLTGQSVPRGAFVAAGPDSFPIPDFRFREDESREVARRQMEDLLLTSASPEALALLPAVEHLDREADRTRMETWLKTGPESDKGVAFRVLGLLARSRGASPGTSAEYFREGAKRGDLESRFRYALSRWSDKSGFAAGSEEAIRFLEEAAASGHGPSQELLARAKWLRNDAVGARRWAERAARRGDASALHLLGLFCLRGIGDEADPVAAAAHFRFAAERGDERAMHDYGRCLLEGRGVEPSRSEAQHWLRLGGAF